MLHGLAANQHSHMFVNAGASSNGWWHGVASVIVIVRNNQRRNTKLAGMTGERYFNESD
jgi:hypothetical protein